MFLHFLKCVNCSLPPDRRTFPLCEYCFSSLNDAPPLCRKCSAVSCGATCKRIWSESAPELRIHSFSARYLLLGPGYGVLKSWKKNHGPALDRLILRPNIVLKTAWKNFEPDQIMPVPQDSRRSWEMGGSPAEKIARWVAKESHTPLALTLEVLRKEKRQAELGIYGRLQNRIEFTVERDLTGKRILIVDDFVTTGKTTQAAAKAIVTAGAAQIHIFSLGVRPSAENQLLIEGALSATVPSVTSGTESENSLEPVA